jgi:hypothetical protein
MFKELEPIDGSANREFASPNREFISRNREFRGKAQPADRSRGHSAAAAANTNTRTIKPVALPAAIGGRRRRE